MSIIKPQEKRIVSPEDPDYSVSVNMLVEDEELLSDLDEKIIEAMAFYPPRTKHREGDICIIVNTPDWIKKRQVYPHLWKVRFVVSRWAWDLIAMARRRGQGNMSPREVLMLLERYRLHNMHQMVEPFIFATGYPHGMWPNSAAWFPEGSLRRTTVRERNQSWEHIVHDAGAEYLGYETEKFHTPYIFDLEPDLYQHGQNLGRPFAVEEPAVQKLYWGGMEQLIELPIVVNEPKTQIVLPPDHDIFRRVG